MPRRAQAAAVSRPSERESCGLDCRRSCSSSIPELSEPTSEPSPTPAFPRTPSSAGQRCVELAPGECRREDLEHQSNGGC